WRMSAPLRWSPAIAEPEGLKVPAVRRRRRRSSFRDYLVLAGTAAVIALVVRTLLAQAFFIPSESMVSTLLVGDRVLVSRISYRIHEPRRGDVVVFESPYGKAPTKQAAPPARVLRFVLEGLGLRQPSTDDFIKRVIGRPGESVEGRDGTILVNGRPLTEPYLAERPNGSFDPVVVPEGHLWVMGDNRNASSDSRVFGPIKKSKVVGRAILRIWPPLRVGFL
ncbi:MAG: signal peptidase I, partial [Acidimicrobiia bacterium]